MVASFTSAGVPLKIFRNPEVRKWIEANVKTGDTPPLRNYFKKTVDSRRKQGYRKTTEMCCNQSVIATVDESIDIKNRKLLNVLIGVAKPGSPARLVTSTFVKKCDGATVCQSVLDSLKLVA
ncbi:hypothetical protein Ocin01_18794 [Orchesella cincta]|uniref:Uncharacterized protein n=1 Tax=Orchesella cincta TaxID=48709 RepID=A0A1D2M4J1_ORCCI|nr:hypothetical protein Ocin01_18794 [Orchesella cincta]